ERPFHNAYGLTLMQHLEARGGWRVFQRLCCPITGIAEGIDWRPASTINYAVQRFAMLGTDQTSAGGDGAYQMMELGFDRSQIREDVRVVVFQIVQNSGAR